MEFTTATQIPPTFSRLFASLEREVRVCLSASPRRSIVARVSFYSCRSSMYDMRDVHLRNKTCMRQRAPPRRAGGPDTTFSERLCETTWKHMKRRDDTWRDETRWDETRWDKTLPRRERLQEAWIELPFVLSSITFLSCSITLLFSRFFFFHFHFSFLPSCFIIYFF